MVKKLLGYLLCFSFVFNSFAVPCIKALEVLSDEEQNIISSETLEYEEQSNTYIESTGNLEVDIKFVLPITNTLKTNMGLNLFNQRGNNINISFDDIIEPSLKTYNLDGKDINVSVRKLDKEGNNLIGIDDTNNIVYIGITIYGLERGEYSLGLYGDGYKTVTTSVTLDDYSKRVSITNEKGMFEPGDVNSDDVIDDKDIDLMISHFGNYDSKFDLNRDGKVDLSDLNYVTASINSITKSISIVNTSYIMDSDNVTISGVQNPDNLINGSGVSIKPSDENQEISEDNPGMLTVDMKNPILMSELRIETGYDNIPTKMEITLVDEDNKEININKSFQEVQDIHNFTDKANPNTIVIGLEGQIAVKRVIIKVTETSSKSLADIAKVDFLNNVYETVPVPNIERPTNLNVTTQSESMIVTYDNMRNVTGYEILVEEMSNGSAVKQTVYQTTYNEFRISGLTNYTEYSVRVQSVNKEWKSGYGNNVVVTPLPTRKPPAPDMVVVTPVYAGFNISWKNMKDTRTYNLYYREALQDEYSVIREIDSNSYQLRDLKVGVTYEIYVTGNNELGEGSKSSLSKETTKDSTPTITPKYKLINTSNGVGELTNHIVDVSLGNGSMSNGERFALVDDDDLTYWQLNDWDSGAEYPDSSAPTITLDDRYTMDTFVISVPDNYNYSYYKALVYYTDENNSVVRVNASISSRRDKNNRVFYIVKANEPITSNKVRIALSVSGSVRNIQMSEIKLYYYDSLVNDVASLFLDDLRVELRSDVTEEIISELENRANSVDEVSGEYHIDRDVILRDLEYARKILNDKAIQDTITVDTRVSSANDSHLGFAMSISDLQPLGVSVRAGETIAVYVGSSTNRLPELVFTQYYAEANSWRVTSQKLVKGQNIINVPKIGSDASERGGSIYIRFPYATGNSVVKVRVSGGVKIPVLDLHDVSDETLKRDLISNYISELNNYVSELPHLYDNSETQYNERTSVLNSTEIVTSEGLFSIPATAALKAINSGLTDNSDKVSRVLESTNAFDEMMNMFYRHKGLSEDSSDKVNITPTSRINIRYMRMFDGAFMYAGGLHIGVGFDSTLGLLVGKAFDNPSFNGYFGWGISHEIGHQINQGKLAYAEVTNNVFSLLAQTANDEAKSRLELSNIYPKIYEKVVSGTTGKASNVFVSLGMYWQLHLAYDNNLTFNDTDSVYSRINKMARTSSLIGSKDDLLVMYASDAVQENLIEFFERWGLVISDEAKEYVNSKYSNNSKAIWYLNDEARRYRINGGTSIVNSTLSASYGDVDTQNKRVVLNFSVDSESDKILGYEIKRNGEVIGFTQGNTYTDIIGALNNVAVKYEVTAYDYLLNVTNTVSLDEVKISHDGTIVKTNFDVQSNFASMDDVIDYEDPDMDYEKLSVNKLIDNDEDTSFNGNVRVDSKSKDDAYIILELNSKVAVSGLKYKAMKDSTGKIDVNTINNYEIYVSSDKENWILAKSGLFNLSNENDHIKVYFDKEGTTGGNQVWTYDDVSYVKIVSVNNKSGISGAEIDLVSPPNDNIDIDSSNIGVLTQDYCYDVNETDEDGNFTGETTKACISAGNIIIKGNYTGNPAFNVGLIVDSLDDSIIYDGEQLFFAKLNSEGDVYDVADGTWIYAVTSLEYENMAGTSVRAVLYRVDDALSLEGQRVTSTSLGILLPRVEDLKPIVIEN